MALMWPGIVAASALKREANTALEAAAKLLAAGSAGVALDCGSLSVQHVANIALEATAGLNCEGVDAVILKLSMLMNSSSNPELSEDALGGEEVDNLVGEDLDMVILKRRGCQ